MRAAVNVVALVSAAAALQSALPVASVAAEEEGDPSAHSRQEGGDRWVPSLALTTGFTIQNWDGAVVSECTGCILDDEGLPVESPLRVPDDGRDLAVTPFFGASFELMTPELPIPTAPRLFIGGDVVAAFGFERAVALVGDPGAVVCPLSEKACGITAYTEDAALGQGSETVATLDGVIYGAYAGIAFPFELYGRAFRLKPSFAWIRTGVDVEGLVADAECLESQSLRPPFSVTTQCNTTTGVLAAEGSLREIRLQAGGSGRFDGIGPGLDIEMDTGRFGPLGTSLFLGGRVYRILGNRKIEFSASQSFEQTFLDDGVTPADGLGPATADARFSFEMDKWSYRVGIGLRFHWLGFND